MLDSMTSSLYDLSLSEWQALCTSWGVPAFRAKQIIEWLYKRIPADVASMNNLPADLREKLASEFRNLHQTARLERVSGSTRTHTKKLLLELHDGQCVETVIIPAKERTTVCVSSQAGCAFQCAFCASGVLGLSRNLTQGEIIAQVIHALQTIGGKPNNIVFMGIGEPFANYDNVMGAIRILNDGNALNIGARHITISTCGVVPGIERFTEEGIQVELSVSLHAPTDKQRDRIMPVNRRWPLAELMTALRRYTETTNRAVTFEYTLIKGFNDRPEDAQNIVRLIGDSRLFRINLIPLSPVKEFDGEAPDDDVMEGFLSFLLKSGIHTTLRWSKGTDADAACGQLRLKARRMGEDYGTTGLRDDSP